MSGDEIPRSAGLLRLAGVLRLVPVSKSSWWAGVKSGRYPRPVRIGPRTTAWRARDIRELVENGIPPEKEER
jgi:prophage regulatory protein